MDDIMKAEIELMIRDHLERKTEGMVTRPFCIERHKEVTDLQDKIKSIDNRLWMLLLLALGQLAGVIIALAK